MHPDTKSFLVPRRATSPFSSGLAPFGDRRVTYYRKEPARALREIGAEAGIAPSAVERAKEPWLKRHRATIITAVIIAAVVMVYTLLRQAGPLSP